MRGFSLKDLSILITGGGSGIGLGAAKYFLERGAKVTICGRRENKIKEAADSLGSSILGIVGDITRGDDRQRLVEGAVRHGGGLDVLVNNAANMYRGAITELQEDELTDIFNSNVIAGMMLSSLCVPHLEKREGSILFVGSVHNRRAFPGASPYAATKAAVQSLTQVLAAELGPRRIRVNCVVPGAVFTEINQRAGLFDDATARARLQGMAGMHALGRIGTEREIAEAMLYLISAKWTTGAIVDVDGGLGLGLTHE